MLNLFGAGIGQHIAIGKAYLLNSSLREVEERYIEPEEVDAEIRRLEHAILRSTKRLVKDKKHLPEGTPIEAQTITDAQLLMLKDPMLVDETYQLIKGSLCSAETAISQNANKLSAVFSKMDDPYLRSKTQDVNFLKNMILTSLLDIENHSFADIKAGDLNDRVLVCHDLSPAETAHIKAHKNTALITDLGGPTSHTAIIAKSLNLPAILGLENATQYIRNGDLLVIDTELGSILVNPDKFTVKAYKQRLSRLKKQHAELDSLIKRPCKTKDGTRIKLFANIEQPKETRQANRANVDGIGLFRSEFLFMEREELPSEQEQYLAYKRVAKDIQKPVNIRTLDLGGDKQLIANKLTIEQANESVSPLGLRAIRMCMNNPSIFEPQLRAILRASAYGKIGLMIPMLTSTSELDQVLAMIKQVKNDLKAKKIKYDKRIKIGAMIEVPSAALSADEFAKKLDFLSIGTNDLIQYTLAIDRVNQSVSYLYNPLDSSILKLIQMTIDAANNAGIPVSLCGEMAANPEYTETLLRLGLRSFSMDSASILHIKKRISEIDLTVTT